MRTLPWLLAAAVAGCNSPYPSDTLPPPADLAPPPTPAPPAIIAPAFGAGAGPALTPAPAMIATGPVEAPFSLTTSDGAGLELTKVSAKAVIEGPLAFTELHLTFRNPEARVREGRFTITLPDEAALSRFAMQIDGQWMEAEVVPKMVARRAYEDFLHRRQDPALLEKADGNEFSARVFPIPANGEKHLILSYSQELREDSYALPLRGLPKVGTIEAQVRVLDAKASAPHELRKQQWKPDRDLLVPVSGTSAVAAGGLVAVRAQVEVPAAMDLVANALILVDSSASRALGYRDQVRAVRELVAALTAYSPQLELEVAAFDQETVSLYKGPGKGFGEAAARALADRAPLGASDLGQALAWAKGKGKRRVIVVTDGMATAGAEASALPAQVLGTGAERLDVVLVGGIRDTSLAATLAQAGLPRAGAVLALDRGPAEVARRLSLATVTQVPISVPGSTWSWPTHLAAAQPGDRVIVFARMAKAGPLSVQVGSTFVAAKPQPVPGPLLARAAARAMIAELEARINAEAKPERKAELRKQLSELSVKHRVLSSETAMLVLETEADYDRYGIPRNSLADVLVVGPTGVTLQHRSGPVLMAAVEEPTGAKGSKAPKQKKMRKDGDRDAASVASDDAPSGGAPADSPSTLDEREESDEQAKEDKLEEASGGDGRGIAIPAAPPPAAAAPSVSRPAPRPSSHRNDVASSAPNRRIASNESQASPIVAQPRAEEPRGPEPLTGELARIMSSLRRKQTAAALAQAWAWRRKEPGEALALIGLGEALEAAGDKAQAARAYGSIIDLFPARADLRRFAGQRLERLGAMARALTIDTYRRALADRPDHLTGYRLLAYALVRDGKLAEAFEVLERGLRQSYPEGRFRGGDRILREDAGLVATAWLAKEPLRAKELLARLSALGAQLESKPSTRFILYWETDANDVDFHIRDARGGHAYYSSQELPSGGELYEDVTTGYGPECFTIPGVPSAGPYRLSINYYSQGPMGYGMGLLEVLVHDGKGGLTFDARPYVVMQPGAFVELGSIGKGGAMIAK